MRRSSVASAMMRTSMDDADPLAGLRLLVAGGDLAAVQSTQARLDALGADATALAGQRRGARPRGHRLAAGGGDRRRRDRGTRCASASTRSGSSAGPPVIGLRTLTAADDELGAIAAARLRATVEQRALRARQAELEAALAAQSLDPPPRRRRGPGGAPATNLAGRRLPRRQHARAHAARRRARRPAGPRAGPARPPGRADPPRPRRCTTSARSRSRTRSCSSPAS